MSEKSLTALLSRPLVSDVSHHRYAARPIRPERCCYRDSIRKSTKKADKTPQVKEIRALIGVVCLNRLNMGNIAPALWRGTMPQTVQLNDPASGDDFGFL